MPTHKKKERNLFNMSSSSSSLLLCEEVLEKLRQRNAREVQPFSNVFKANMKAQKSLNELQIELVKIKRELITKQDVLTIALEEQSKQKRTKDNTEKVSRLQEELASAHKKTLEVMEMASTANKEREKAQIELEKTHTELQRKNQELKNLRESCTNLENELHLAQKAGQIAAAEAESRREDKLAAIEKFEKLEQENQHLVERVMEMKMKEAEKMNEINDLYEDLQRQKKASILNSIAIEMNATAATSMRGLSLDADMNSNSDSVLLKTIPNRQHFRCQMEGPIHRVSFVRSGDMLGTCGDDKRVSLVDMNSGQVTAHLEGALGSLLDISFSPDDKFCIAGGVDKAIQLWEISTGRVKHRLTGHSDKVVGVDFCRMDKQKAVSCSHDRTIREWDLTKGICVSSTPCASNVNTVVYGDTSQFLVSGHLDGGVRIWDLRQRGGQISNEKKGVHDQQITSIQMLSSEREILTCGRDNVIRILDFRTLEVSGEISNASFRVGTSWTNPCFSPNQSHIACGGVDGAIFIWSAKDQILRATLRGHDAVVATCAWSPSGLASCDKNGKCLLWN